MAGQIGSTCTAAAVGLCTLLLSALCYWENIASRRYCKSTASLEGKTAITTGPIGWSTTSLVGVFTLLFLYALHYWKNIASRRYCQSNARLQGNTVVITGGNSGIGKATALDLARRGARVILACRNLQKAEDVAKEIRACTGNSEVVVRRLDLASLKSIREFAERILESESRLNILVNNAGVAGVQENMKTTTEDNFHIVFGTNHFGHFLLTNLLDLLKKSAPSRVVTVASNVHAVKFLQMDLAREADCSRGDGGVFYPRLRDYHHSKLANVLFSRELARRLVSTGVTSVSLHPGVIYTPIWNSMRERHWTFKVVYFCLSPWLWLLCLDEKTGAQTTLHCALDESVPHLSGRYFTNCAVAEESPMARDDKAARKLWDISCQATGFEEGKLNWSEIAKSSLEHRF